MASILGSFGIGRIDPLIIYLSCAVFIFGFLVACIRDVHTRAWLKSKLMRKPWMVVTVIHAGNKAEVFERAKSDKLMVKDSPNGYILLDDSGIVPLNSSVFYYYVNAVLGTSMRLLSGQVEPQYPNAREVGAVIKNQQDNALAWGDLLAEKIIPEMVKHIKTLTLIVLILFVAAGIGAYMAFQANNSAIIAAKACQGLAPEVAKLVNATVA